MLKQTLSALLLLTCLNCHASTIGKVLDGSKTLPLSGVKVFILGKTEIEAAYSNSHGLFEIDAQYGDTLRFEKDGFSMAQVIVSPTRVVYAQLQPAELEQLAPLDTLLSTAGRNEQKVSQIPASVVVIGRQEIARMGYNDLEELLRNVPGIYAIEEYDWTGGGSNVGVRGFLTSGMNNAMMVMVNGVTQFEDYWGFYPLSRINVPIEAIERVEIVRGPMSVVYGSGALLGAINIITRNSTVAKTNSNDSLVTLNNSSNNDRRFAFRVNSGGNLSQTLLGSFERGDDADFDLANLSSSTGINISAPNALQYRKAYLSIAGDYKNKITFNANLAQADKGILLDIGSQQRSEQSARQNAHMVGFNFALSVQQFWRQQSVRTKTTASYYNHSSNQDYSSGHDFFGFASYRSSAYQLEFDTFIDGQMLWNIPIDASFGAMQRVAFDLHTTFDVPGEFSTDRYIRLLPADELRLQSIYGQADYQWLDNLRLTAGVRVEKGNDYSIVYGYHQRPAELPLPMCPDQDPSNQAQPFEVCGQYVNPGITYTPRLGLLYSVNDDNVFKLLYGKGIRQPSFGQNSDVLINQNTLSHEVVDAYEVIYLNQHYDKADNFSMNSQMSLFYNRLDGLIFRQSSGAYDSDTTGGNTFGLELSTDININDTHASFALSYQQSRSKDIPLAVPISPKLLAYFKLGRRLGEHTDLGLSLRYLDNMYNDYSCSELSCNHLIVDNPKSSAAWLLDLHLKIEQPYQVPVSLGLSAKNLLDRNYTHPLTLNSQWADQGIPATGRQLQLLIQYQF